ncbi:MAG: hypothetical protein AAB663_02380 [Patescibacteria group bacterium]
MDTEQQPPKSAVMRVHTLAVVAASVMLIVIAFLAGLFVAMRGAQLVDTEVGDDVTEGEVIDDEEAVDDTETISVDWLSPTKFDGGYDPRLYAETIANEDLLVESSTAMKVGMVTEGKYIGWNVIANVVARADLGTSYRTVYTLGSNDTDMDGKSTEYVVLSSPVIQGFFAGVGSSVAFRDLYPDADVPLVDVVLDGLVPPATLSTDDATFVQVAVGENVMYPDVVNVIDYAYVGATEYGPLHTVGDVITDGFSGIRNAFLVQSPAGNVYWYDVAIPFWTQEDRRSGVPAVVIDGSTNAAIYLKGKVGGCGFSDISDVVTDVPALVPVGYAVSDASVVIYEPADYTLAAFDDEYASWSAMNAGGTREAFADIHPLFYYQDALGRWIQFTKVDVVPPGECGKPVIYLYPTTTTNIDVSLAPQGGFTKTEPAYGNGWHVTAQPDGTLTNLADGLTYPYLFWEGRGGMYSAPQKYWVVAKADVPSFLTSTLAKLGLNAKESADFTEFWLPRMTAAPYYKIGFHGTNVMNAIAPMTLSQKADTLLRVLMDYSELAAPIAANPPTLGATPVRHGFTVIEWGGVIR